MLGGGLYNYEGAATVTNSRIVGNTADYADIAGGSAIYNLDGSLLTVLDSTIADNRSSAGRAVASFLWGTSFAVRVRIVNSILYNGGNEVWCNLSGLVSVTYSDVQGGATGTGNISTDPQFVQPGTWATNGSWTDGNYRLKGTSPAIDVGSSTALPADSLDLDADGNTTEPLPLDLAGAARVLGTQVDMGAYEQLAQKPPASTPNLNVVITNYLIPLKVDPNAPSSSNTYIGSLAVNLNGVPTVLQLRVDVTATSAAGGTWTGWAVPSTVSPTQTLTTIWVRGQNLNLAALPAGLKDVQVAEASLYYALPGQ
jgi:hypothetical protein